MVLELLFGVVILVIVVFVAMRVVGNIAFGLVLIGLVFIASFLILGHIPSLKNLPVIGHFFSFIPSTTGEAIAIVRDTFFSIDIIGTSRDSQNNLLITIANTGRFDITGFRVYVDNTTVNILNDPKEPLKSKETTTIQTNWKSPLTTILVETEQAKATYSS